MTNYEKYKEDCFSYCKKHGTMRCPNSDKCLALDDRPYFEFDPSKLRGINRFKYWLSQKIQWLQEESE